MTTEFNIGDYVEVIDSFENEEFFSAGARGHIIEILNGGSEVAIQFNSGEYDDSGCALGELGSWYAHIEGIKLVTSAGNEPKLSREEQLLSRFAKYL